MTTPVFTEPMTPARPSHGRKLLGDEGAPLVLGLVVPLHHLDGELLLAHLDAAGGVDLGDGQLGAVAHGNPHGRRTACEWAGEGDLDGVPRAQGHSQKAQEQGPEEEWPWNTPVRKVDA